MEMYSKSEWLESISKTLQSLSDKGNVEDFASLVVEKLPSYYVQAFYQNTTNDRSKTVLRELQRVESDIIKKNEVLGNIGSDILSKINIINHKYKDVEKEYLKYLNELSQFATASINASKKKPGAQTLGQKKLAKNLAVLFYENFETVPKVSKELEATNFGNFCSVVNDILKQINYKKLNDESLGKQKFLDFSMKYDAIKNALDELKAEKRF